MHVDVDIRAEELSIYMRTLHVLNMQKKLTLLCLVRVFLLGDHRVPLDFGGESQREWKSSEVFIMPLARKERRLPVRKKGWGCPKLPVKSLSRY